LDFLFNALASPHTSNLKLCPSPTKKFWWLPIWVR